MVHGPISKGNAMSEENVNEQPASNGGSSNDKPMPPWVGRQSVPTADDESASSYDASMKPIPNGISSSMSGPGIGDDVAMKRAHLMSAAARGELKAGRRPTPEPYDPWPTRWMYIRGMLLGALVIVIVFVILIVAGAMTPID